MNRVYIKLEIIQLVEERIKILDIIDRAIEAKNFLHDLDTIYYHPLSYDYQFRYYYILRVIDELDFLKKEEKRILKNIKREYYKRLVKVKNSHTKLIREYINPKYKYVYN